MDRRSFIHRAAAGGGAAIATLGAGSAAAQTASVKWGVQSTVPRGAAGLDTLQDALPARLATMSGGRLAVQMQPATDVPGLLTAVSSGAVHAALTTASLHTSSDKAFALVSGLPFGMNARLQYAWYRYGGGQEVLQELFDAHNLVHFVAGNTGSQMGGLFRKEVKSVADLKGLKMRIGGFGGDVLAALGVLPQQVPPGELAAALQQGRIDATAAGIPVVDEKLGLHKSAKFYYTGGFWDVTSQNSLFVHKEAWTPLPNSLKEGVALTVGALNAEMLAYFDASNHDALERMVAQGAQLRSMPRVVLDKAYDAAFDLYQAEAGRNAMFKKIYTHWAKFREDAYRWNAFNEIPLDQYVTTRLSAKRRSG